jgi:hypothetical protein
MKNVWVDAGNDPDFNKGDQNEINGYFLALFDSRTTKTQLENIKAKGYQVGVYMVTNWPEFVGKTPAQIAKLVSDEYKRLNVKSLRVQFDMEEKDPDKIASVLEEWRLLHPSVNTSWTMEAGQGGWMGQVFVARVLACRVRLVPQCYNGAMTQVWDTLTYSRDLTQRGFPDSLISPFYDAAHLPVGWDGFAFTQGRLP